MRWFRELDRLLRGERTTPDPGESGLDLPLGVFVPLALGLGASYGFFMGWYALIRHRGSAASDGWLQLFAAAVKVPALYLLTLAVTFPSLYVFNALVGVRLRFLAVLRLLVAAIVVNLAVAASLSTILGFFTLSTTSYPFMVVLNVALLGIAGLVGLTFLLRTLHRLSPPNPALRPGEGSPAGAIFYVWVVIFGLVGLQMGWLLRPFIGHPSAPFEWFRPRSGNFFEGLADNLHRLLGP